MKLVADIDPEFSVDYSAVDPRLEAARRESMAFLRRALTAETKETK